MDVDHIEASHVYIINYPNKERTEQEQGARYFGENRTAGSMIV